jgi:DNA-binding beta-propeller fold protein YncE
MQTMTAIVASFAALCFTFSAPASAQNGWHVTKTFKIGGEGRWDYVAVDRQTHRLYVTRSTHTMVIDSETGKTIADIPGQKSAHGVALDPETGRGFISDGGGSGAVVIFDLKTNAILGRIIAEPDADGIIFDKASNRVLVVSGDGGSLMSLKPDIDPKNGKMDEPIDLGGKPEFLASDGAGKVYVNLENKDKVAVVDMKTRKVVADWPVAPGGEPVGMSINPQEGYLFIGCRKPQKLIVMSTHGGKIVADMPIGAGVDATRTYAQWAFASCGDGTLAIAKEQSPGKFEIAQNIKTLRGARTMGMDDGTRDIYLPTAEFETPKPGVRGRPAIKPGTFMIVVAQPYK